MTRGQPLRTARAGRAGSASAAPLPGRSASATWCPISAANRWCRGAVGDARPMSMPSHRSTGESIYALSASRNRGFSGRHDGSGEPHRGACGDVAGRADRQLVRRSTGSSCAGIGQLRAHGTRLWPSAGTRCGPASTGRPRRCASWAKTIRCDGRADPVAHRQARTVAGREGDADQGDPPPGQETTLQTITSLCSPSQRRRLADGSVPTDLLIY